MHVNRSTEEGFWVWSLGLAHFFLCLISSQGTETQPRFQRTSPLRHSMPELGMLPFKIPDWSSSSASKLQASGRPRLSEGTEPEKEGFPRGGLPRVSFREPLVSGEPNPPCPEQSPTNTQLLQNGGASWRQPRSTSDSSLKLASQEWRPKRGTWEVKRASLSYSASEGAFPSLHQRYTPQGWDFSSSDSSDSSSEEEGYFLGEPIPLPPHLRGGVGTTKITPPTDSARKQQRRRLRVVRDKNCVVA